MTSISMGILAKGYLRGFFYNTIIILCILSDLGISSVPFNGDESHSQIKDEENSEFSFAFIIISLSTLCAFVILLTLCGFDCLFWRKRQNAVPGFSNPIVEHGMGPIMSPIDASALELDPVVFEPLPNISELSPHSFLSPTIPLSLNDSTIFAHDWFEEPHKNFPRGQIEYAKEIGKGWFGQVIESEAFDIVPFTRKMKVNVKVLREDANSVEQMRFLDEARVFRDSNHGNVMKLLGHSIETMPFILILEHFPLGDLKTYLISSVSRAEMFNAQRIIPRMALDVARGLEWIISNGFFHGDLSCRNCQVGSEGRIVLGDYGLATQTYRDDYFWSYNIAIPIRWAAPETLHCTPTTIQTLKVTGMANVWSYGVVLWELCSFGKLPYSDMVDDDVINRVICEKDYTLNRPLLPLSDTESLYSVMQNCFSITPTDRPQMGKIVEQLEDLISEDLFEKKWEKFGKDMNQKKSVSFSGIEDLYNLSKEDEEEELWRQNVEKSTVTQKVIEKSQSVQDLMILTHVEESDLNEMESLSFGVNNDSGMSFEEKLGEVKSSLAASLSENSTSQETFEVTLPDDTNEKSKSMGLNKNSPNIGVTFNVMDSSPIPEIKFIDPTKKLIANSFQSTPNLDVVKINIIEPTPIKDGENFQVTPNPNIQIKIIEPTPIPNVKINFIAPTPSPGVNINEEAVINATQVIEPRVETKPKKLKFLFDDEVQVKGRKASTPIKSPGVNVYENLELEDGVFEISPPNQTCSISPISSSEKESTSSESNKTPDSFNGQREGTSISMGADDSFELKPYQKVTSTIENAQKSNESQELSEFGFNKTFIEETDSNELRNTDPKGVGLSWDVLTKSDVIDETPSWDNVTDNPSDKEEIHEPRKDLTKLINETKETETESLYKTPNTDLSCETNSGKFVSAVSFEDAITAATNEYGSLVLTDLEGQNVPVIVPEKKGTADSPLNDLKVPFIRDESEGSGDQYHPDFEAESDDEVRTLNQAASETLEFVPSKWDVSLVPSKSAIKSPDITTSSGDSKSSLRKSVSFERKKQEYVYQYEPEPKEIPIQNAPMQATLDWDLSSEELEAAIVHEDDSEDEVLKFEKNLMGNPIDLYRLSAGFLEDEDSGCQNPPEKFDTEIFEGEAGAFGGKNNSRLGELRHTRENLRLDLSRGEASFLEESNEKKLDSGVGSSTNVSPFNPPKTLNNNCDKESE